MSISGKADRLNLLSARSIELNNLGQPDDQKEGDNNLKPENESKIESNNTAKSANKNKFLKNEAKSANPNKYKPTDPVRSQSGLSIKSTDKSIQSTTTVSDKNKNMVVSEYEVEKGVETIRNPFTHFKGFSQWPSWIVYLLANILVLCTVALIGTILGFVYYKVGFFFLFIIISFQYNNLITVY